MEFFDDFAYFVLDSNVTGDNNFIPRDDMHFRDEEVQKVFISESEPESEVDNNLVDLTTGMGTKNEVVIEHDNDNQ